PCRFIVGGSGRCLRPHPAGTPRSFRSRAPGSPASCGRHVSDPVLPSLTLPPSSLETRLPNAHSGPLAGDQENGTAWLSYAQIGRILRQTQAPRIDLLPRKLLSWPSDFNARVTDPVRAAREFRTSASVARNSVARAVEDRGPAQKVPPGPSCKRNEQK